MQIDPTTLADLGLDDVAGDSTPLLDFLYRGRMAETRHRWRALIANPLSSIEAIQSRQRDLQQLVALPADFWPDHVSATIAKVELYLARRRSAFPATRAGAFMARTRDARAYEKTVDGVRAVRSLLTWAGDAARIARQFDRGRGELHDCIERMQVDRDAVEASGVMSARNDASIVRCDRSLRFEHHERLYTLVQTAYEIDARYSLAMLGTAPGFVYPTFLDDGHPTIRLDGVFHPLLGAPVGNDLALDATHGLVFLTGPNMAGKSTYLRACALAVLLAHTGAAVPARGAALSVFHRVFGAFTIRDSIQRGESYYLAEVRRVAQLVKYLLDGERVFSVLDEAFKGTNVHDALDATQLLTTSLATCPHSATILASHLSELPESRLEIPRIRFSYFDAIDVDGGIRFDYRCTPGISHRRMGMSILEAEGVVGALERLATGASRPTTGEPSG